ncbi:MAG: imidazolonepropionase [Candidatus Sericytochromatia bacterium]|nr:imidazolonepropionase [Candidatus Sericytochromatia bacterium]
MTHTAALLVDTLLVNIGELCTLAGPPGPRRGAALREVGAVRDAAIALAGDRIAWLGPTRDAAAAVTLRPDGLLLDARGLTVTPGLVDPHTHLVFGGSRAEEFARRLEGVGYAEILAAGGGIHHTVAHTRAASREDLVRRGREHLGRMLAHGTTTLEAKSGYGLDLETELKQLEAIAQLAAEGPLEIVPTFMGAHAVPPGEDAEAFTDRVVAEMIPVVAARKLARYVDVFCEQGVFSPAQTERIFAAAKAHGFGLRLHADELSDLGGGALAARWGAASADHLLCAGPDSIAALAASDTVAVMLPGTPFFLGMIERAPARRLIEAGAALALGTDFNPGSCYSESMPMMLTLACLHLRLTPSEALTCATLNAAHALGLGGRIGSLEVGKQADLVVWDAPSHHHLPYHFGVSLVRHVIKHGRVLA